MAFQPFSTSKNSKTYQNQTNPSKFALDVAAIPLHYESELDSGNFDTPVDLSLTQVDNAQLDGWLVNSNQYHYAFGIDKLNHPGEDGWIAFGGRQGNHWLKFRLERVGYLRYSNLTWTDLGGLPTYNRTNLSQSNKRLTLPLEENPINVGFGAEWRNLWTTPNSGEVWLEILGNGDRLKINPVLNKSAWDYAKTQYPGTGPQQNQYYFGFILRVDHSDIPRAYKNQILQDLSSDFDDDSGQSKIEFRDNLDQLLASLPLDDLIVRSPEKEQLERLRLRKRIYQNNGNTYILIGARVDQLNALTVPSDAEIVFDPTVDAQQSANEQSAKEDSSGNTDFGTISIRVNDNDIGGYHWPGIAVPQGATVDVAYLDLYFNNTTRDVANHTIYCDDTDDSAAPSSGAANFDLSSRSTTTSSAAWVNSDVTGGSIGFYQSPSAVGPFQELFDRTGWVSGNDVTVLIYWTATAGDIQTGTYDLAAENAPKLHIEYTAAAASTKTFALDGILKSVANTRTFKIDTVLKKTDNRTFVLDSTLKATTQSQFILDTILKSTSNQSTFALDGILKSEQNTRSFVLDTLLVNTQLRTFVFDANLQSTSTRAFISDAILKSEQNNKTFVFDTFLTSTQLKTFTIDTILKATTQNTFTLDAVLSLSGNVRSFVLDAFLTSAGNRTFTLDSVLKSQSNIRNSTLDSILKSQSNQRTFVLDSTLKATTQNTFTLDTILKSQSNQSSFTLDATFKSQSNTRSFVLQTNLTSANLRSFVLDSILKSQSNITSFTLDTITKQTDTKSFSLDAILKSQSTQSTFILDSIIQSVSTQRQFLLDGVLKLQSNQRTFVLDTVLVSTVTSSKLFALDAILKSTSNQKQFILDAQLIPSTFNINLISLTASYDQIINLSGSYDQSIDLTGSYDQIIDLISSY